MSRKYILLGNKNKLNIYKNNNIGTLSKYIKLFFNIATQLLKQLS